MRDKSCVRSPISAIATVENDTSNDSILAPQNALHAAAPQGRFRRTKVALAAAARHDSSAALALGDRKSTRLNSSHRCISYAVFCLKKKIKIKVSIMRHSLDLPR